MALYKSILTNTGLECNYWILSKLEKDKISESAYVVLYGYPSKAIRDSGYSFLEKRFLNIYPEDYRLVFDIEKINKEGMNETKSVYEFIKTHFEEFKDAEDI